MIHWPGFRNAPHHNPIQGVDRIVARFHLIWVSLIMPVESGKTQISPQPFPVSGNQLTHGCPKLFGPSGCCWATSAPELAGLFCGTCTLLLCLCGETGTNGDMVQSQLIFIQKVKGVTFLKGTLTQKEKD